MTLLRLQTTRQLAAEVNAGALNRPTPKIVLTRKLEWFLCFVSLTALLFSNVSATISAFAFLTAAALFGLTVPIRAFGALFSDWLPWPFVILVLVSVSWSAVPDLSARYGVELALTAGAALVLARMAPYSFLSALMCAVLVIDVVGLLVGRYALNAGAFAMIGAFGSKNAFSAAQAVLFLTSFWVLLSANQEKLMRSLALIGVFGCPFLLIAGRSTDAVAPVVLATGVTLLIYSTRRLPPLARVMALCAGALLIICIFGLAFIFRDTLFGQVLVVTGKDVTLSGRTYLWARATELMQQKPLLGMGYGAFWVQGNPYAEQLWAHFQLTGRGGFNFHNLWFDMGIQLGYLGIAISLVTVLIVSARVFRWVVRAPSAESLFFLGFMMIVDMRSLLESELFSQFSLSWVIVIVAGYYARYAQRTASVQPLPVGEARVGLVRR